MSSSSTPSWGDYACRILEEGGVADREAILEFIGIQSTPLESDGERLFALIQEHILHSETNIRYHARKAQAHLVAMFPQLGRKAYGIADSSGEVPAAGDVRAARAEDSSALSAGTTRDILLKKLHLESRYLVFEVIERLTDSHDPTLADAMLAYLESETDTFKISYLAKRLTRISHPKIPPAMQKLLSHPDPRVVANALEGLTACNVPEMLDTFRGLAHSQDNRIRANAVRALARYEANTAEAHIEEMLRSNSVALQDSAVFLIGVLRPSRMEMLLDIALESRFTAIRLRALEIPRMVATLKNVGGTVSGTSATAGCETRPMTGLAIWLIAGSICHFAWPAQYTMAPIILGIAGILTVSASIYSPGDARYWPWGLSTLFLAAQATGTAGMVPLFGWLMIWLGIPTTATTTGGRRGRLLAWIFAAFSAMIGWWLGGVELRFVAAMAGFTPSASSEIIVLDMLGQFKRFTAIFFSAAAIGCYLFAGWGGFNEGSENAHHKGGELITRDIHLYKRFAIGLFIMLILQASYSFGLKAMLVTRGFDVLAIPGLFGR
ncbi:MAG: HEAT repeat domain-containing protein [Candidatus Riflebacteria bacterium]|nr:HEAT repeat domain-containing protein [Candidatus Riflebacteria bacterium]